MPESPDIAVRRFAALSASLIFPHHHGWREDESIHEFGNVRQLAEHPAMWRRKSRLDLWATVCDADQQYIIHRGQFKVWLVADKTLDHEQFERSLYFTK
jgi:hypothetical protein